jgi:hypothetical protein
MPDEKIKNHRVKASVGTGMRMDDMQGLQSDQRQAAV